MFTVYEPPVRNSGIIGGKFLERTRVAKPNSAPDRPVFYGPQDFHIGAVIEIFKHRFVITNADEYVLKYMEDHKEQFPGKVIGQVKLKISALNCKHFLTHQIEHMFWVLKRTVSLRLFF